MDEPFASDLGNAPYFIIVGLNRGNVDVIGSFENPHKNASQKKGAMVAGFMREHDVDVVITGHAGEGAKQWLRGYGIEVKLISNSGKTVRDVVKLFASDPALLG
ncbi:MAG: NifB/NifX family molybdenum-iron cluster-binding protein [Halobacteriota archaeon]